MTRRPADEFERARGRRLASELKKARLSASLSQEALARRAGLSVETVRKLERGERHSPELFTVSSLTGVLGLSIDQLIESLATDGERRWV